MTNDSIHAPDVAKPIHIHQINGRPLRYFKAPNESEAFPWIVFTDLVGCAVLPRDIEKRFTSGDMIAPFRDQMRIIQVNGGEALIAPLSVSQGFMGAMEHLFPQSEKIESHFVDGLKSAVDAGYPELSDVDRFRLILTMGRYHLGADDPVRRSPDLDVTEEGEEA